MLNFCFGESHFQGYNAAYQAADILGIANVHISRLKQKVLTFGMHSLL